MLPEQTASLRSLRALLERISARTSALSDEEVTLIGTPKLCVSSYVVLCCVAVHPKGRLDREPMLTSYREGRFCNWEWLALCLFR